MTFQVLVGCTHQIVGGILSLIHRCACRDRKKKLQLVHVRRYPDGREPIAGARFLSCCDLSIFYQRVADGLLQPQENRRSTWGREAAYMYVDLPIEIFQHFKSIVGKSMISGKLRLTTTTTKGRVHSNSISRSCTICIQSALTTNLVTSFT